MPFTFMHPAMDLREKLYPAIGEFIFRCAQLEYQLQEIIWFSLGLDYKKGRTLTVGMTGNTLRQLLKTITSADQWIINKDYIREINSITTQQEKLSVIRNDIAHGSWQSPDGTEKGASLIEMKKKDERIMPKLSAINAEQLRKHCAELRKLNLRAQKLIVELGGPAPYKKPEPHQQA